MENPEEQQGQDAAQLPDDEAAETVPSPSTEGGDPAEARELEPGPSGDPAEALEFKPVKPVDNPHLPLDGDPDDFGEEPVDEEKFEKNIDNDESADNFEAQEEPNDLSEIEKEFED